MFSFWPADLMSSRYTDENNSPTYLGGAHKRFFRHLLPVRATFGPSVVEIVIYKNLRLNQKLEFPTFVVFFKFLFKNIVFCSLFFSFFIYSNFHFVISFYFYFLCFSFFIILSFPFFIFFF